MSRKILVLVRRGERVEEIVPYVRRIAESGMKVVFLVPYPVDLWLWLEVHWVATESTRKARLAGRKILEDSWEKQRALAEQKVLPARQALGDDGLEISVDLFTGNLRTVFKDYGSDGEVQWIMVRQGKNILQECLLHRIRILLGLESRPQTRPMLVSLAPPALDLEVDKRSPYEAAAG